MVAIQHLFIQGRVPVSSIGQKKIKENNNQVVHMSAYSPTLLQDYLTLVGRQNQSLVSFGAQNPDIGKAKQYVSHMPIISHGVTPYDGNFLVETFRPGLSSYAQWKIREEATKRIYGEYPWPKVDNINAWMVTAETDKFMAVGGLAKVAADLPNSFNQRYANDAKNNMTVITPLYTYIDEEKNNRYEIVKKNRKFYYRYGERIDQKTGKSVPRMIEIRPIGKVNVPIYNPQTNTRLQDTEVQLYKGYADYTINRESNEPNGDGTEYIFLHTPQQRIDEFGNKVSNAEIFNIEDRDKTPNNKTPYANNKGGTDEVTRMAFFSKAVYTMMKDAKEGKLKEIEAPNSVLLNDWHAGGLAAMMRYVANAEADTGKISKETGLYFNDVPTIFIAHNLEHQGSTGWDDNKRTSIFATLFGEYGADIISNAKSWRHSDPIFNPKPEYSNSLMKGNSFNSAVTGVMLADRIVPVSEYYAEELIHSDIKANGLKDLLNARAFSPFVSTLTPITNGYSKSLIEPTSRNMASLMEQNKKDFTLNNKLSIKLDDVKLLPFDDGNLSTKKHNKNEVMKIFRRVLDREREFATNGNGPANRKYLLHDPFNTEIPNLENYEDVPIVVFSGRVDPQKGLGTILKDALIQYAKENVNTPVEKLPLFIIGGKISQQSTYDALKDMKDYLFNADNGAYKEIAKRIVLVNGYVNTNLLATAADLFMVPSVFEPCGLTQMEAMAKGALPIATSTGGLVNTVRDGIDGFRTKAFFEQQGHETKDRLYGEGFSTNGEAYCEALNRAINTFRDNRTRFEEMQKVALKNDFSWNVPGGALDKYINLMRTGQTS